VPKRVFISYRREDSGSSAGRVYDRLRKIFPESNVYFDLSTIKAGEDFTKSIASAIERSDVVLVFMGKNWMAPRHENDRTRIWDPNDYVRAELRAALVRPILVLPVLVDGALMVQPELLPDDVKAIATRNAVPLRLESFDDDTENIVTAILGASAKERLWDDRSKITTKLGFSLAGCIVAFAILGVGALAHFWILARPLSASIGAPATTLSLILAAVLGVWMGLLYEARRRRQYLGPKKGSGLGSNGTRA
jgi:TIR domain